MPQKWFRAFMVSMPSIEAHQRLGELQATMIATGNADKGSARLITNGWRRLESIVFEKPPKKKMTKEEAKAHLAKIGMKITVVPKWRSKKT